MNRLLKEPLLHFLILGGVIFAFHEWRNGGEMESEKAIANRIEVDANTIAKLREGWTKQFQIPPAADDLRGMVADHIREEVLYREAMQLGLDRDDTIIRRRLAQKMEFLTQDILSLAVPDDAALETYFQQNASRYAEPAALSFRHIYFSKEKRPATWEADVKEALAALATPGVSEEAFGDPFLSGYEFEQHVEQDIAGIFGPEFAAAAVKAPSGAWSGPITSSYGVHLIRVTGRGETKPAVFAEVRDEVLRDFLEERRRVGNADVLDRMTQNYEIVVDEAALKEAAEGVGKTVEVSP